MRSKIPFKRILENLKLVGRHFPITLQSCFFQKEDQLFHPDMLKSYIRTVTNLLNEETRIEEIQAYTVARPPAENFVRAWDNKTMDNIGAILQTNLQVPVKVYYGK